MTLPKLASNLDHGKPMWHLLPYDSIDEVAKVLTRAAVGAPGEKPKYAPRNWELGLEWSRQFSSAMRHLKDFWQQGIDYDPETGLPCLAHAACRILMLLAYQLRAVGVDDRPRSRVSHGEDSAAGC